MNHKTDIDTPDISITGEGGTELLKWIVNKLYPVGAYYISNVATNPRTLFGVGTWTELDSGTFLMAVGSGKTATVGVNDHGNPGGMHELTEQELPPHRHGMPVGGYSNLNPGLGCQVWGWDSSYSPTQPYNTEQPGSIGSGQKFSICPPTVSTHIWRRTGK